MSVVPPRRRSVLQLSSSAWQSITLCDPIQPYRVVSRDEEIQADDSGALGHHTAIIVCLCSRAADIVLFPLEALFRDSRRRRDQKSAEGDIKYDPNAHEYDMYLFWQVHIHPEQSAHEPTMTCHANRSSARKR